MTQTHNTPYVIDYTFNGDSLFSLIRTKDDAILYANNNLQNVINFARRQGLTGLDFIIL